MDIIEYVNKAKVLTILGDDPRAEDVKALKSFKLPERHGRWVKIGPFYKCSICGYRNIVSPYFCECCGAMMEEESDSK